MKDDQTKKKETPISIDKSDRVLQTHYFVVYLIENDDQHIVETRTERFEVPFDIENKLVREIEKFGDIDYVEKDTYAKWIGEDVSMDFDKDGYDEVILQKNKVYDVISTQNGRAVLDLGYALYGWVRPENFKIIKVTGELDYENGTIH